MSINNFEDKNKVYPTDFFNLPHPIAPWTSIQFRTSIKTKGSSVFRKEDWTEITLNPSNHFDNFTITDSGGLQNITLTLTDKNFSKLESVIVKSVLAARFANIIGEEGEPVKDESGIFEFKMDNNSMINLRVRFGYSYQEHDSQRFIDDITFDGDFKNRTTEKKTVIRSPWIYFQLIGARFNLTDTGLTVELKAYSVVDNFLSRAKMMKKFAIYKGTPLDILTGLKTVVEKASNETLTLVFEDKPEPIKNENGTNEIEINLGGSPNGRVSWKSIKSLFNEICVKTPPRVYTKDDVKLPEGENVEGGEKISKSIQYTYRVEQTIKNEEIFATITFYYPDPIKKKDEQNIVRTYVWREFGMSIVESLSVESKLDFASLNMPVVTKDGSNTNAYSISGGAGVNEDSNPLGTHLNGPQEIVKAIEDDAYEYALVSNVINMENGSGDRQQSGIIARQITHNMNQGVFEGTINLSGDPFWFFDGAVKPYQYVIRIIILRPEYINENGELIQESVSYLSGFYVVKTITHTVNNSGFKTILGIMRWPTES